MALLAAAGTGHGHQVSLSAAPAGGEELPVMTSKAIRSGGPGRGQSITPSGAA
jgi:hypothetical protein